MPKIQVQNFSDEVVSHLSKKYYKKRTTTQEDFENIMQILDLFAKVLPKEINASKITNFAEVASFFYFKNRPFWQFIESFILS